MANDYPRTIAELQAFCEAHDMPLEQMRFFIGEDYREPRAFGIYRETDGSYVVYKNKADGSRAVRYQGPDEAFAVKELYLKLRSEVDLRYKDGKPVKLNKKQSCALAIIAVIVVVALGLVALFSSDDSGYYRYDDSYYYYQSSVWYMYDYAYGGWTYADDLDDTFTSHSRDYYLGENYKDEYADITSFEDSDYFVPSSSDSSWDNDYSGWDSGATDWSSSW